MNIYKISGIIGLLIAIVGAFVRIPYAVTLMTIAGIIVGISVTAEHHVRVIVSALGLAAIAASFSELPTVGTYVTAILAGIAHVIAGAALLIILRNVWNRITT